MDPIRLFSKMQSYAPTFQITLRKRSLYQSSKPSFENGHSFHVRAVSVHKLFYTFFP